MRAGDAATVSLSRATLDPVVALAGGEYAVIGIADAVTDGNLVAAPAWPAHPTWLAQFLAVLGTRISG